MRELAIGRNAFDPACVDDRCSRLCALGIVSRSRGRKPTRRASACSTLTHNNASNAMTIGANATDTNPSRAAGIYGVVSNTTNGSAISDPTRRAIGPNRRNQIDTNMPATKTAAPIHGARRSSTPTPTATRPTIGSAMAASIRPSGSRSRWLRESEMHNTTASTAEPAPGAIANAHASVARAASMVTQASLNAPRRAATPEELSCAPILASPSAFAIRVIWIYQLGEHRQLFHQLGSLLSWAYSTDSVTPCPNI